MSNSRFSEYNNSDDYDRQIDTLIELAIREDLASRRDIADYYIRVSYSGSNGLDGFKKVLIEDIDEQLVMQEP